MADGLCSTAAAVAAAAAADELEEREGKPEEICG
jgi:hypothetical protein